MLPYNSLLLFYVVDKVTSSVFFPKALLLKNILGSFYVV